MKRLFTCLAALMLISGAFAQPPEKMSYQAVVRNGSNQLVTNQAIGMKISILQGTSTGTIVYQETYNPNPQTNANGLVTIEIGNGIPIAGTFSSIDWSAGPYFLKTETDPTGGTNYTITGTSELLSVPYALHARTVDTEKQQLSLNDKQLSISGGNTVDLPAENQQLSVSGEQLSISDGNTVDLPTTYNNFSTTSSLNVGISGVSFNDATEITGTTDATNNYINICLPSGYGVSNTRVLSVGIQKSSFLNYEYSYGLGYVGTNGTVGYYLFYTRFITIGSCSNSITIFYPDELKDLPFRVFLLKVSVP
jgi:hypothetical protein